MTVKGYWLLNIKLSFLNWKNEKTHTEYARAESTSAEVKL